MPRHTSKKPVKSIVEIAPRLTARDFNIVNELNRLRVMSLTQLKRIYFGSFSAARERLSVLFDLEVLSRFRHSNRSEYLYFPGLWGLRIKHSMQVERHIEESEGYYGGAPRRMPRGPNRGDVEIEAARLVSNPQLGHILGVNDFYTRLADRCYADGESVLHDWESESEASRIINGDPILGNGIGLRPDGGGSATVNNRVVSWWYEFDTGSETLKTLIDKVAIYRKGYQFSVDNLRRVVLIELTKNGREENFHRELASTDIGISVATTTVSRSENPIAPIWWPVGMDLGSWKRLDELDYYNNRQLLLRFLVSNGLNVAKR